MHEMNAIMLIQRLLGGIPEKGENDEGGQNQQNQILEGVYAYTVPNPFLKTNDCDFKIKEPAIQFSNITDFRKSN